MSDELFLTPDEVVARWKGAVQKETLKRWRRLREGPSFVRLGRAVRYPVSSIERYEERNGVRPICD